jgi:hypothetical protein
MIVEGVQNVYVTAGNPSRKEYTQSTTVIGKTVEAEAMGQVEGQYGDEPCSIIMFTDGTAHAYVHPRHDD